MADTDTISEHRQDVWISAYRRESISPNKNELHISQTETPSLIPRLTVDTATALTAAISVAPAMTIIDKGITENAAGRASILVSMRNSLTTLVRRPGHFVTRPTFATMMLLYSSTYLMANYVDTLSSYADDAPASQTTASWTKFCAVSSVNMGLSVYKDSRFARAFGTVAPRPLTLGSYVPFVIRDSLTIFASFNVPSLIAPSLPESLDAFTSRLLLAQMIAPSGIQFFSSPLHLLGLDIYNRRARLPWQDRFAFIRRAWPSTSAARACRVFVAFGLGGVVNTGVRTRLMERLN